MGLSLGTVIALIKTLGKPSAAAIKSSVEDWLDDHPEATTTVEDGSITKAKLDSDLQETVDDVGDLKNGLNNNESMIIGGNVIAPLEQGTISISGSGWTYGNSNYVVRTKQGETLYLLKGDKISLSDYTNYKFYLGWRLSNGTYKYKGWNTADFTVEDNAEYVFVVRRIVDADLPVSTVEGILTITRGKPVYSAFSDIDATQYSIGENSYYSQSKTGISSNVNFTVPKGTTQKVLLKCNLFKNKKITISGKLKTALSASTFLYLQDSNGNNLLTGISYTIPSGNTVFSTTFTPTQDYANCSLKYTISSSVTTDAVFEHILISGDVPSKEYHATAYNSTIVSENVVQYEYTYPVIYKASSINFKTSSNAYSGVEIYITENIAIGESITLRGTRNAGNNFALRIDFKDGSGQRIGSEVSTTGNVLTRVIPEGTAQITITLSGCWGTEIGDNTSVTFSDVEVYYSAIEGLQGRGSNLYTGKQIVLSNDSQQEHKCNIAQWKNFLGTEIPGLADYNLQWNHSMTIYGGYVFLFQERGTALILDYSTKAILSEATIAPTSGQHHNSAQFTNLFYDSGDEFPLLITARCGNANQGATDGDECQVYRVTRSDTTFTFTLVNRIFADITTKGSSWGIDNVTNRIYMVGMQSGWYESGTHKPLFLGVWNMPTMEQIKSGTDITLYKDDCIAKTELPDVTIQGMCVNGGIIYIGISSGTQFVYAIDVFANRILSKVPLTVNIEVEGVSVYNSKLYVSQKRGSDTTGTNPCEIYELVF